MRANEPRSDITLLARETVVHSRAKSTMFCRRSPNERLWLDAMPCSKCPSRPNSDGCTVRFCRAMRRKRERVRAYRVIASGSSRHVERTSVAISKNSRSPAALRRRPKIDCSCALVLSPEWRPCATQLFQRLLRANDLLYLEELLRRRLLHCTHCDHLLALHERATHVILNDLRDHRPN